MASPTASRYATVIRFGGEVERVLRKLPTQGPLFPYLTTVRASDRATEFKQRCNGLGISGVTFRHVWVFAQYGTNSILFLRTGVELP